MNVAAAATIAVYFVGLVNFSVDNDPREREVVAPRAMTEIPRKVGMSPAVTLEMHRPDIIINPLTKEECRKLGGGMFRSVGRCSLFNVTGRHITLPAGAPSSLDASAHNIPKLQALCSQVTGIQSQYLDDPTKYAVRLTLKSGKLDSCAYGAAWGSRLVLNDSDGQLTIEDKVHGKTTVTLADGATIHIINAPTTNPLTSDKEHFWWHYVIAKDATACIDVPTIGPPSGSSFCSAALDHNHSGMDPAASGLGCSNSQYP